MFQPGCNIISQMCGIQSTHYLIFYIKNYYHKSADLLEYNYKIIHCQNLRKMSKYFQSLLCYSMLKAE